MVKSEFLTLLLYLSKDKYITHTLQLHTSICGLFTMSLEGERSLPQEFKSNMETSCRIKENFKGRMRDKT